METVAAAYHIDFNSGVVVSECLEHSGFWHEHFKVISQLFSSGAWRLCWVGTTSLCAEQDVMQVSLSVEL